MHPPGRLSCYVPSSRILAPLLLVLLASACEPLDPCESDGPASIEISGHPETLEVGESLPIVAIVRDRCGDRLDWDVEWTASPIRVARVHADALLVGRDTGTAILRAVAANVDGLADSVSVPVVRILRVGLSAETRIVWTASHIWIGAGVVDYAGVSHPIAVQLTSLDPAIATVAPNGRIDGHMPGVTYIVGSAAGAQPDTLAIEVRTPELRQLVIRAPVSMFYIEPGVAWTGSPMSRIAVVKSVDSNTTMTAWVRRESGDTVPYGGAVVWGSSNPSIVSVHGSGVVDGHALGRTSITLSDPHGQIQSGTLPILTSHAFTEQPLSFKAVALNDDGDIAGYNGIGEVLLLRDGALSTLGYGAPRAINNSDVVVGFRYPAGGGSSIPVIWQEGVQQDLPLGGCTAGEALDINNAGVVVGTATCGGQPSALRWIGGVLQTIALDAIAYTVDDLGVVAGMLGGRAAVWTASGPQILAAPSEGAPTAVLDRSQAGRAVGYTTISNIRTRGMRWDANGASQFYEGWILPTTTLSNPSLIIDAVNEAGVMVGRRGYQLQGDMRSHAREPVVIYGDLPPVPLPFAPGQGFNGVAINESGQILIEGRLFTPIPF